MQLYPQYTRITNYNKLIDRFITVQSRTSSSNDKGTVFGLIEILNPWSQNAQIGQRIINTLSREYHKQTNTNDLIKFENALKTVNEKLVQITQNGETDWIGKTNAVLILISKNQIHLSYTGRIRGYLFRDKELMPIINPKEIYTYQHPLKTFSSVISGDIKLNDRLFFSTNLLFDYLSQKNLKSIIEEDNFFTVPFQIANILKARNCRNANSICINIQDKEQNFEDLPEVVYIDEQKLSYYTQIAKNFFKKLSFHSKKSYDWSRQQFSKSKAYYKSNIAPHASKMMSKTKQFSKEKLTYSKNKISQTFKKLPQNELNRKKQINETLPKNPTSPNVNYYYSSKEKIGSFFKKTIIFFKKIFSWITHFLHNAFLPKNRSKTYVIIATILLVIFIANIGYIQKLNRHKETAAEIQENLTELEIKKDDAALLIITGDNQKATEILDEISEKLNEYESNNQHKERIENLKKDIQKLYDKIAGVNRLTNAQQIASFSSDSINFYILGNKTLSLTDSKQIYVSTLDPLTAPEELTRIPSDAGDIVTSTNIDEDIYLYTSNEQVYKLSSDKLTKIENQSGTWQKASDIKTYYSNIYLLNSFEGQIYRYKPDNNTYSAQESYIKENPQETQNAVSFAIDGSIYVLTSEGNVLKYSQGAKLNFDLTDIPTNTKTSNPKKIVTAEDMDSIYILYENSILEFNKEGSYINQFSFESDIKNISDFTIYPKTKELYILNDGKIYRYNI